jgi:uncharacterized protein (TIGR02145 family)
VNNIPGEPAKCWITSNLGADRQATAVNDAAEASAGWYWQFNRRQGYQHDGSIRTPNTTWINSIDENLDWLAASDPCTAEFGSVWRIPTFSEWNNVDAIGNWVDWNGPWSSGLKLHAAGFLDPGMGSLVNRGVGGNYWSPKQDDGVNAYDLDIYSAHSNMFYINKTYGFSLRCLRNDPMVYPLLQVPGSYQGWKPADSSTTIASKETYGKYEGYLWFGGDNTQFKYTLGPAWTTNWGDNNADGTLDPGGANIIAGALGYYKLNVNLDSLTHRFLRTAWAVVGSAVWGWSNDADMTYDTGLKVWTITIDLMGGSIKFRANHSWALNYGDNGADGTLEEFGANITVPEAGNYTVTLDLSKPVYSYKLTNNTMPCGSPFSIAHFAGTVAPVTKTVMYNTVSHIPGEASKCWITSNLGADRQATGVNDATEASAGWHWQFNRKQGYKHDGTNRTPNTAWITSISENLDWQSASDPCVLELAGGWRIPTYTEWFNVDSAGNWTNWNGPWNSGLKLHGAGYLSTGNGSLSGRGSYGGYWCSSQVSADLGLYLAAGGGCYIITSDKETGFSLRCIRELPPTVTTSAVSGIGLNNATSGGNVTFGGSTPVTARGVCWSIYINPTTYNSHTDDGDGDGSFVSELTGLLENTWYYIRAYAVNEAGTTYGDLVAFKTWGCGDPVIYGNDGKSYNTVQIGSQCWFKENLNVGTMVTDHYTGVPHTHAGNNGIIEKYCYENNPANCDTWGGLYDWNEMMDYSVIPGSRGICPPGWHIPTDAEFCALTTYLDSTTDCNGGGILGVDAGGKLKATGTAYWASPNAGATNLSGFSALGSGVRGAEGFSTEIFIRTYFWSSGESSAEWALDWYLENLYSGVGRENDYKACGETVRCIKD